MANRSYSNCPVQLSFAYSHVSQLCRPGGAVGDDCLTYNDILLGAVSVGEALQHSGRIRSQN